MTRSTAAILLVLGFGISLMLMAILLAPDNSSVGTVSARTEKRSPTPLPTPEPSFPKTESVTSGAVGGTEDIAFDQPPAFIYDDPELRETYQRARTIYTDPSETEVSRQRKIRVLQQNVGAEAVTLVLRYVPVVDLKDGTIQTFDSHMREMAKSYDSERGSPLDRDPVGATMKMLFDPSPETIREMTGIGPALDDSSSNENQYDDRYEEESRRRERQRAYEAEQAREELRESWEDVQESLEEVGDAVGEASETLSDVFKSLREDE